MFRSHNRKLQNIWFKQSRSSCRHKRRTTNWFQAEETLAGEGARRCLKTGLTRFQVSLGRHSQSQPASTQFGILDSNQTKSVLAKYTESSCQTVWVNAVQRVVIGSEHLLQKEFTIFTTRNMQNFTCRSQCTVYGNQSRGRWKLSRPNFLYQTSFIIQNMKLKRSLN